MSSVCPYGIPDELKIASEIVFSIANGPKIHLKETPYDFIITGNGKSCHKII